MNRIVSLFVCDYYVYVALETRKGQRINRVATVQEFPPETVRWMAANGVRVDYQSVELPVWEAALSDVKEL